MENYRNEQLKKYSGVRSWLLLLCVIITIGVPLHTLYNLFTSYQVSFQYFQISPNFERYFYIDLVLSLIIIALSLRAGIALWTLKSGAVRTAQKYLFILLIYTVITVFLPITVGIYTEVNELLIIEIIMSCLQSIVFFGVWYSYLNVSTRVKATYLSSSNSKEVEAFCFLKFRGCRVNLK